MDTATHPRWKPPVALVVAVIAVCLAVVIERISHIIPLFVAGQAYLLIIIFFGFRYWPPLGRWMGRMPVPHRVIFGVLLAGMVIGHFTLDGRKYFPYVSWAIFSSLREEDPITCREFMATTASGKTVRLLAEQLLPSIVQFNPPGDNDGRPMTHLVESLARIYNRLHPGDPVQSVDLVQLAVKLHPAASESRHLPSCELLKHYDISSAPSN